MTEPAERMIRLVVEYDGADLCGWQRQDNGPTVQQHLEEAVSRLCNQPISCTAASRTDAGVHALGQVVAFRTTAQVPLHGIRRGLNSLLPPAIAIADATEVDLSFHPRFHARGKHYRYSLHDRPDRSPLHRRTAWHRPHRLDLDRMRAGAAPLIGEHDFAAFRAAGCNARTTTRRITRIEVERAGDLVLLDVHGNAFLRNMVRIVAGNLVEVAESRREPAEIAAILASRDRTKAGQTAPAHGLCLVEVLY